MDSRIHCIGDSHACFFSGVAKSRLPWPAPSPDQIPLFKTYWLGAFLAYNLINKDELFVCLKKIPKDEKVMLIFGEIDCRAHLIKQQRETNKALEKIVEDCAKRYISAILKVKKTHPNILIWGVVASTKFEGPLDNIYPTVGTCLERNTATKMFNEYLQNFASKNNIPFISVFDKLVDKKGITNMAYYRDRIHLNQKIMPRGN